MDLWREVQRVLRPAARVALIAPREIVDEVARTLDLVTVAATPVRLLGQEVQIAFLAQDDSLVVPAQLFATELEQSFARYGSTPAREHRPEDIR